MLAKIYKTFLCNDMVFVVIGCKKLISSVVSCKVVGEILNRDDE